MAWHGMDPASAPARCPSPGPRPGVLACLRRRRFLLILMPAVTHARGRPTGQRSVRPVMGFTNAHFPG
eukprot:6078404-Lingulodinium_polyedra.AAC.1